MWTGEMVGLEGQMANVGTEKIGMLDVPAARLDPMTQNGSPEGMENSTDGTTARILETPITSEEPGTETAVSPQGRMASRDEPNSKAAGSAMRIPTTLPMPMMIDHPHETENGAVIDMVQTATGPAAPSSNKSLNGWIATTEMSHDEHIHRRTLSAGKSG